MCARFGVDRTTGLNGAGHRLLRVFAPPEQSWARVELRASRDDRDPLVLVDVEMGPFGVSRAVLRPGRGPRLRRDSASTGTRTDRTRSSARSTRNLHRGAPGRCGRARARPGATAGSGCSAGCSTPWTSSAGCSGRSCSSSSRSSITRPSSTSGTAATTCSAGSSWRPSSAEFRPGGRSGGALDGSTVFRQPGFDRTIRGRSWAIHDGILGALGGTAWGGVKMYRQVGRPASVSTFPDAAY